MQNPEKTPRSVPPPPPPEASHSRPNVRRLTMDELLDDFIVRASQRVSSIRARQWDLLIPPIEVDASQIIDDEAKVAPLDAQMAEPATNSAIATAPEKLETHIPSVIVSGDALVPSRIVSSAVSVSEVSEPLETPAPATVPTENLAEPAAAVSVVPSANPAEAGVPHIAVESSQSAEPELAASSAGAATDTLTGNEAVAEKAPEKNEEKNEERDAPRTGQTQFSARGGKKRKHRRDQPIAVPPENKSTEARASSASSDDTQPEQETPSAKESLATKETPPSVASSVETAREARETKSAPVQTASSASTAAASRPVPLKIPVESAEKKSGGRGALFVGIALAAGVAIAAMYFLQGGKGTNTATTPSVAQPAPVVQPPPVVQPVPVVQPPPVVQPSQNVQDPSIPPAPSATSGAASLPAPSADTSGPVTGKTAPAAETPQVALPKPESAPSATDRVLPREATSTASSAMPVAVQNAEKPTEKAEKPVEKVEKPERTERALKTDSAVTEDAKPETEKATKPAKPEKAAKPEKTSKPDKPAKPEKSAKSVAAPKTEAAPKSADKPEKSEKAPAKSKKDETWIDPFAQ